MPNKQISNPRIVVTFSFGILSVIYLPWAIVDSNDLKEIYAFGDRMSQGKKYIIIFEAEAGYEVRDDAVQYILKNPSHANLLGKAYVITSKEAEMKTKFHLIFDEPPFPPNTFTSREEALAWASAELEKVQA